MYNVLILGLRLTTKPCKINQIVRVGTYYNIIYYLLSGPIHASFQTNIITFYFMRENDLAKRVH